MKSPLQVLNLYPPHDYTLRGAFESRASRDPGRPFMLFEAETWTWQAFDAEVRSVASLLVERGIAKGDRVAVMGRNSDGHVIMLYALARVGGIMVPVNPEFGVEEARYVLHHAEVSAVVASGEALPVAREAAQGLGAAPWFLTLDGASGDVQGLREAARHASAREPDRAVGADDTFLIVYTSGTTGFPKGAMHSQRSFVTGG